MKVLRLKTTESTNQDCFRCLKTEKSALVIAETQTKGKGRNINRWESPKGNIYLSVGKIIKIDKLPNLSQKVSVEILKYLNSIVKDSAKLSLKWPNDIFLNEKKMCGILVETKISGNDAMTVIGVGLNFENAPLKESIALKEFVNILKEDVEMGIAEGCLGSFDVDDMKGVYDYFNKYNLLSKGDLIEFRINENFQKGKYLEITRNMELMVEINGKTLFLNSAEVRKIAKSS